MKNGLRIMDSDLHVMEPDDLWLRYIDERFRDRAPQGMRIEGLGLRQMGLLVDGRSPMRAGSTDTWGDALRQHMEPLDRDYAFAAERGWDNVSQLQAMDREGIDVAAQFPTRGLFAVAFDSIAAAGDAGLAADLADAISRAYNDWMRDFCTGDDRRMFGAGLIAPFDIDMAVEEIRRCARQLGFRAIFLLPGWIDQRPWHDARYDPLWEACQAENLAVCFHGGGPDLRHQDFGLGFYTSHFIWHTFAHCLGGMTACASFIGGGVFDRFPRLRAGFLEANCSWAPWLIERLEDHFDDYDGRYLLSLEREVPEYFVDNCFVSAESGERALRHYIAEFGDDNVVFSTDYPHADCKFPHAVDRFLTLPIAEDYKRKILWDNCARLYDLDPVSGTARPAHGVAT